MEIDEDKVAAWFFRAVEWVAASQERLGGVALIFLSIFMFLDLFGIGHRLSVPFAILLLFSGIVLILSAFMESDDDASAM